MIDQAHYIDQLDRGELVCAIPFRCSRCGRVAGGAWYSGAGLIGLLFDVTAIDRYENIDDARANALAWQVPGPRRGRWGDWGWRMDSVHDFAAEPASECAARCECGHRLVLDWPTVNTALQAGKKKLAL